MVQSFNSAFENDPYIDIPVKGWVHVTARDMFNWMQALYGHEIISAKSIEVLAKSRSPKELGSLMLGEIEDGRLVYHKHHGSSLQWESLIMHDAKHNMSVVILTNKKERKLFDIMRQLEAINKGEAFQVPKISLFKTLDEDCAESVSMCLSTYETLKLDSSDIYDFDNKRVLNNLGYRALGRSDKSGAIAIFSKYVSEFPEWADAYDSLGEAYMLDGQYDISQQNYKRALEIDPTNENAKKMLADIEIKMSK